MWNFYSFLILTSSLELLNFPVQLYNRRILHLRHLSILNKPSWNCSLFTILIRFRQNLNSACAISVTMTGASQLARLLMQLNISLLFSCITLPTAGCLDMIWPDIPARSLTATRLCLFNLSNNSIEFMVFLILLSVT